MNDNHSVSVNNEVVAGENLFPATPIKRKKPINKEAVAGTMFASIPLIGFLLFGAIPLVMAFAMAFLNIERQFGFDGATWAGFDNFKEVLGDENFWESIVNTLIFGISTLLCLVLSLLVAYLLSKDIKGKKTFRVIYFIPYVCSTVAIVLMWRYIFNPQFGILNQMLGRTGDDNYINWFRTPKYFYTMIIFISVWGGMGYSIILFTAALTNINRSTVEAATIDGAGAFRVFWNIVLPGISPTSFYLLVTGIIGALQAFAISNIFSQKGDPDGKGITIVFYLYNKIFDQMNMGEASASAWVLSILILIVTIINFVGSKKWVSYDQ